MGWPARLIGVQQVNQREPEVPETIVIYVLKFMLRFGADFAHELVPLAPPLRMLVHTCA